jgi:pSer/pThr/pTyr-binding forkhead associated (FHA) protein
VATVVPIRTHPQRILDTATPSATEIRLWLKSPPFDQVWPVEGLRLQRVPFVIGRLPTADDDAPHSHVDLRLPDAMPFQLSRVHFCILNLDGRLAVMDTNSHLGTVVNGVGIGRGRERNHALLVAGMNQLTVGTSAARFVFELRVA